MNKRKRETDNALVMRNYYESDKIKKYLQDEPKNPCFDNTHIQFGSRVMIVGSSGSGKTNAIVDFIVQSPNVFKNVIVVNRGQPEPLYQVVADELGKTGSIDFFSLADLPDPMEIHQAMDDPKKDQYIVILDDLIADIKSSRKMAKKVENLFLMGRKCHLTTFYITHNWFGNPMLVRQNMTHCLLNKVNSTKDFLRMAAECTQLGATREQLRDMHRFARSFSNLNFLKIDLGAVPPERRFSVGWTNFFRVETYVDMAGDDAFHIYPPASHKRRRLQAPSDEEESSGVESENESD